MIRSVKLRRKTPTKSNSSERMARKRRRETYEAAQKIHGGSTVNGDLEPGEVGLVDTVIKKCRTSLVADKVMKSRRIMQEVTKKIKIKAKRYEKSQKNKIRSVAVYYSGGVMGKRKYRKIYRELSYESNDRGKQNVRLEVSGCPIPNLLSFEKLMSFVKQILIGKVYSVADTLCEGLEEKVEGCYRGLEDTLLGMARYYLSSPKYELTWFNNEPYTFYVSLGGDGAPFGADDTATAWLVGFLNVTKAVLSSNENYLIFGANTCEDSIPAKRYLEKLCKEIETIEEKTYVLSHNNQPVNVKFYVAELPNDMKMLAFISGELSNSAKYFSSFSDVTKETGVFIDGTFGKEEKHKWHPWKYSDRLAVVKEVNSLKQKLSKAKVSESNKRNKITTFIASKSSRQEFIPPLGSIIDRAHVEPLHLKNNLCALLHRHFLETVLKLSITHGFSSFAQLPKKCPFSCYVRTLQEKCGLQRLAKKVVKWFDDNRGKERSFDYRFTGRDSRMFVHNFMFLISCIDNSAHIDLERDPKARSHLHALAFLCLTLRDCISIFSRIQVNEEQVSRLEKLSRTFFRIHQLVFSFHPSVWTLGFIVPHHTRDMKEKYGLGLGLNSMEGREAKHRSISRYAVNTNFQSRWHQVFMHEYISLVWLRERGHNQTTDTTAASLPYIPNRTSQPEFCYCGFGKKPEDVQCKYCLHPMRSQLIESDKKGKLIN